MESIITFIVILLIGSLFGGKNKKKEAEQNRSKPFTAQDNQQQTPFKKLKEMSQEMYRELQQEMQQEPEQKKPTVIRTEVATPREPVIAVRPVEEVKRPNRKTRDQSANDSRSTRQQNKPVMKVTQASSKTIDLFPRTEEDIMKGIIFSEILGPPKSKR